MSLALKSGRSAAWLARVNWDHEVPGSNPGAPTRRSGRSSEAEHRPSEPRVAGSNPVARSIKFFAGLTEIFGDFKNIDS